MENQSQLRILLQIRLGIVNPEVQWTLFPNIVIAVPSEPWLWYVSDVLNIDGEATNNEINIDDCFDQVAWGHNSLLC